MLFPYKYPSHTIEKLQIYIDFLFLEVWCKANLDFTIEMINGCQDLKDIVLETNSNGKFKNDYLYGPIHSVYDAFKILNNTQKLTLENWYRKNNSIEELCKNDLNSFPTTYPEFEKNFPDIAVELKLFFVNLFENVLHLSVVQKKIGIIDDHFKAFTIANNEELCPFCGLSDLKGPYSSKRDAYDHFLPKSIYPFNSINFKNLAPMCHECNSSYKLKQNPLYQMPNRDPLHISKGSRRKAFYPYTSDTIDIIITVNLLTNDIENLVPSDMELIISSHNFQEEVETWKEIFGIEERYKDKMRKKNSGKYWMTQIMEESGNYQISPEDFLKAKKKTAKKNQWADTNFLRIPFLEACERKNLFL